MGSVFLSLKLSVILFRIQSFLSYLWNGKSRYHVHSDFVFHYINKVLRSQSTDENWAQIEAIRATLLKDKTPLEPLDFGAKNDLKVHTVASKVNNTAIPPVYGRLISRTVAYFNAANVLELGTGTGFSAFYLACAAPVKQLISLEGNPALAKLAKEQLNKLGYRNAELITGDFNSTLSAALGKLGTVDLAFIDGDHRRDATIKYYEAMLPHTHNDTVLIFDDINWSPEMQGAWQTIIARPEVTLSLDFNRMGMVFFRKEIRQPQHLKLYYW